MKLLFDQNISFRIVKLILADFPNSNHVKKLGLENAADLEIWKFAKDNEFHIVTFDADFVDIQQLNGFPPKIIWLRIGNTSTKEVTRLLNLRSSQISEFIESKIYSEIGCLEILD